MTFGLCNKRAWEFGQVLAGADGEFSCSLLFVFYFLWRSSRCFGCGMVGEVLLVRIGCRSRHRPLVWVGVYRRVGDKKMFLRQCHAATGNKDKVSGGPPSRCNTICVSDVTRV